METKKITVAVVGAGPSGLANSACLKVQNIPHILLEREDCYASLWQKRAYGRLKLHTAKEFSELPHFSYPPNYPTYIPKNSFIEYLDDYVSHFRIHPIFNTQVTSAAFDHDNKHWVVEVENNLSRVKQTWTAEFLVVASGENSEGFIPPLSGLSCFCGDVIHSSKYGDGDKFRDRNVLVVGSGNSGMEIALDLANWGANTSIVIRTPYLIIQAHVLDETMVRISMVMMQYFPLYLVDVVAVMLSKWKYGNLSDCGMERPEGGGPYYLKRTTGRTPVIDLGTIRKIRENKIKIFPAVERVDKDSVYFTNGNKLECDAIVLATGLTFGREWIAEEESCTTLEGKNGLYCVGFARNGLLAINMDARATVADITAILSRKN
ncbi:hypothetical protein ACS0TY_028140 [Phlomoides rotata]